MNTVGERYARALAERGYHSDEAQLRAVTALQRCADEWAAYKARRSNAVTKLLVRPPIPVSYTHLDVYKRQLRHLRARR